MSHSRQGKSSLWRNMQTRLKSKIQKTKQAFKWHRGNKVNEDLVNDEGKIINEAGISDQSEDLGLMAIMKHVLQKFE